ncbi:hypothetical protein THASP1DRAFT_28659 [Thamnocephalis sphaerospora]|uniref:C2H2-type domain-containing protein n=1 Tax=Thamnocephalis sphaerospora TaxID=78915 RepID=A0A4P9XTQ2_9FUNG|nr:hypothetical protein THASP1DRAFT_28659 [Thamnocephalis sphaerospora]|eukprot:RKP09557.1 hypothetical protein THASP1DRAFT_28659 [Thamnocephalis sphaerospora]
MPRIAVDGLHSLERSHLPLLQQMLACGRRLASEAYLLQKSAVGNDELRLKCANVDDDDDVEGSPRTEIHLNVPGFVAGFHARPSMRSDLYSTNVKTKRHYNSFATDFFRPVENVLQTLERNGRIEMFPQERCEALLKQPLVCHRCALPLANMPKLREHLKEHLLEQG